MKKLYTLLAAMMLFSLAGCKDATAGISNGSEALITIDGDKITNDDIYGLIKTSAGATETLNLVKEQIYKKENIKVSDAMKKEAEESVKSLKSMYGDNLEKTLKQYGYDDLEDYKKKSVYPGLQQKELNKKYIKAKESSLFNSYYPVKAQILEADSKKKAENALKALKDDKNFKAAVKEYGTTTTYKGTEEIYNTKSGLPTTVFDKIKSTNKKGLIDSVIEDTTNKKYYVVNVISVTPKDFEEDAINSIAEKASSDIEPAATAYYLKKYDFTIYDKDVYDGIKSTNESYIVQD
ncbi:peptidyl-prolyl cis-trans isomerase [[Clostridium] innocuum]|nr:peptidyl-prolyl cis-trans isomerase [[Clostridium] innocuum]